MEHDQWHMQEFGTAWKSARLYHVTLSIPTRDELLGKLDIPENAPSKARVIRTELGGQSFTLYSGYKIFIRR